MYIFLVLELYRLSLYYAFFGEALAHYQEPRHCERSEAIFTPTAPRVTKTHLSWRLLRYARNDVIWRH